LLFIIFYYSRLIFCFFFYVENQKVLGRNVIRKSVERHQHTPSSQSPKRQWASTSSSSRGCGREYERDAVAVAAVAVIDQTSKEPSGVSIISAGTGGWQESVLAL
jgi:hypothetical protein